MSDATPRAAQWVAMGLIAGLALPPAASSLRDNVSDVASAILQHVSAQDPVVTTVARTATTRTISVDGMRVVETLVPVVDQATCRRAVARARKEGAAIMVLGSESSPDACRGATYPTMLQIRHTPGVDV